MLCQDGRAFFFGGEAVKNIPVYSLVAFSGTGKTTYLEALIRCLRQTGLRVGVIKHDGHDFEADTPGKDSYRFAEAGAVVTAVSSSTKTMWTEYRPLTPEEVAARMTDVDLILTEGYKTGPFPKVALFRAGSGKPLAVPLADCAAVVTDTPLAADCPQFEWNDVQALASWLLREIGR